MHASTAEAHRTLKMPTHGMIEGGRADNRADNNKQAEQQETEAHQTYEKRCGHVGGVPPNVLTHVLKSVWLETKAQLRRGYQERKRERYRENERQNKRRKCTESGGREICITREGEAKNKEDTMYR